MKKKLIIISITMLLLSTALLSGCTEITGKVDGEVDGEVDQIRYKQGLLDAVVYNYMDNEMNLIFNDDTVLNYYSSNDETSDYDDLLGHEIKIRYFKGEWNFKIIDIELYDAGVGTNNYSDEDVMVNLQLVIDYIDEVFIPEGNDTVDIERIEHDYEFTNDTIYLLDIYDMWCVNNSGYFYFVKNNDDVFYIEDVTKTKSDIFGHVTHHYLIYLDKNILPEP